MKLLSPEGCSGAVLLALVAALTFTSAQRKEIDNRANLHLLLERPAEPIYYGARGPDQNIVFQIPESYMRSRYRPKVNEINSRFGNARPFNVPQIQVPDLSLPMQLNKRDHFSLFIPYHRRMAKRLIEIFMGMRTYEDFVSAGTFCRENINPYLYSYAMSVAILHRKDTAGAQLPELPGIFPEKFFDRAAFPEIRRETSLVDPAQRIPIEIPLDWTATDMEPEHRVAYFREDVGINVNHHSWHLVYPFDGPREIVAKDRRGELFYYFHQQIIARYNFERFSNRLARVERLLNFRDPIPEGYFSKLDSMLSSRTWPSRPAGMRISDIRREDMQITFDIATLERWRDRFFEAVQTGQVEAANGTRIPLDARNGIDILGNIMEASPVLSINMNRYGDLHNLGHVILGLVHDPDHRHLETFSVLAEPTTAMRDPVFYKWHSLIDHMFAQHKQTLTPYTAKELGFDGIRVTRVSLQSLRVNRPNEFSTFWQQSDLDLSQGLDFVPQGPVFVRVTHLQHAPFSYNIQVSNSGARRTGTVRIFMAPRFDERSSALNFREQRLLFIELDKFQFDFKPGNNTVRRQSVNSSVTAPYDRTFRNLTADLGQVGAVREQLNYCGCGWPQHMLIPKGSQEGLAADLFVMVSNYNDDRVNPPMQPNKCSQGHSYCGIFNQRYPDRRPMGYPFDRLPRQGVGNLAQFLLPNMAVTPVTIKFNPTTVRPQNTNTTVVGPGSRSGNRAVNNSERAQPRPGPSATTNNRSAQSARRPSRPGPPNNRNRQ